MPSTSSSHKPNKADNSKAGQKRNAQVSRDEGSGGNTQHHEPERPTEASTSTSGHATGATALQRMASSTQTEPSQSTSATATVQYQTSKQTRDQTLPDSGQISESATSKPVEAPIWDWEAPADNNSNNNNESVNYYFEPQGELVDEQREQRQPRHEFTIPQPVAGSGINWTGTSSPTKVNDNNGFAVPRRPSSVTGFIAGLKRKSTSDATLLPSLRSTDPKRQSIRMSDSADEPISPTDARPPSQSTRSQSQTGPATTRTRSATDAPDMTPRQSTAGAESGNPFFPPGTTGGIRRAATEPCAPMVLPARKVFPIQIGDKLFRLSGASISSDAPSYFSQFFEEQLRQTEGADTVRTLYIDRDPATFEDIALHLQGYHVEPRDGPHFVKLFADAQFFSLPRLTTQLFSSTIYIRIGEEEFQIPRDLFNNPGDSPNYFSLGFSIFFSTPTDAFPGLSQRSLLRPPSILPPSVPNRSARTFADILHFLKGYPVEIRNEKHRQELLRDARYFHLKGLEQRLIPHSISYNLARQKSEIIIRLEDIRQSGISFLGDSAGGLSAAPSPAPSTPGPGPSAQNVPGWVFYQRPYIDSESYSLIVEIAGEESTFLSIAPAPANTTARVGRATFRRAALSRVTSLFTVIANKMNLPVTQPLGVMMLERGAGVASLPVSPGNTGLSEERVKVRIGADADVLVDGRKWVVGPSDDDTDDDDESSMDIDAAGGGGADASRTGTGTGTGRKRKRGGGEEDDGEEWVLKRAQWRLRVQPVAAGTAAAQSSKTGMEVILGAVKIEAYSNERGRNLARGFLG